MTKAEIAYALAVLVFAATFVVRSFRMSGPAPETGPTSAPAVVDSPPARGRGRDIDVRALRQMIEAGKLSGREAEFYHPVAPGSHGARRGDGKE